MGRDAGKMVYKEYNGKDYIFQFSPGTASEMERAGFEVSEKFFSKPIIALQTMCYYALKKNHPNITKDKVDGIIEAMKEDGKDIDDFSTKLVYLYSDIINPKSEEGKEKVKVEIE